jgi:hypothetical protein
VLVQSEDSRSKVTSWDVVVVVVGAAVVGEPVVGEGVVPVGVGEGVAVGHEFVSCLQTTSFQD